MQKHLLSLGLVFSILGFGGPSNAERSRTPLQAFRALMARKAAKGEGRSGLRARLEPTRLALRHGAERAGEWVQTQQGVATNFLRRETQAIGQWSAEKQAAAKGFVQHEAVALREWSAEKKAAAKSFVHDKARAFERLSAKPRAAARKALAWHSPPLGEWFAHTKEDVGAWFKADPRRKWMAPIVATAGAGVLVFALQAAPLISATVGAWATPSLGGTLAPAVGSGVSGAISCGLGSLWAHGSFMALGVDPFHPRQLATDTGLSMGFNLIGLAHANLVKQAGPYIIPAFGAGAGIAFAGLTLVGWEMIKHQAENAIRNRVAKPNDPKFFYRLPKDKAAEGHRAIWPKTLALMVATTAPRFLIPGAEDNMLIKVASDFIQRPAWDRIVNARNPGNHEAMNEKLRQQREGARTQGGK